MISKVDCSIDSCLIPLAGHRRIYEIAEEFDIIILEDDPIPIDGLADHARERRRRPLMTWA